jgi:hypothetical protein
MIGLLDPALFLPRDESDIVNDLNYIINACRKYSIELSPFREYWRPLWAELGKRLQQSLSPKGKSALQMLQRIAPSTDDHIAIYDSSCSSPWRRGFSCLFDSPCFDRSWSDRMAESIIRAVSTGEEVVLFCRLLDGRNVQYHRPASSELREVTRWALYVQMRDTGSKQVLCMHHVRNFEAKWTSRFDWRLPASADACRYPFCPPAEWWKGSTESFRTVSSKAAWIDARGNGWARPNINCGTGYHWDVYLRNSVDVGATGVDQINVVEFGAPQGEGRAGFLHHVPSNKKHKVQDAGWFC